MGVYVDFRCNSCGKTISLEVAPPTWELPCECGGWMMRLIQVNFVYPRVQTEECISDLKAILNEVEPDERVIRATHFFNYGEEPDKETIKDVKKHRLMVW